MQTKITDTYINLIGKYLSKQKDDVWNPVESSWSTMLKKVSCLITTQSKQTRICVFFIVYFSQFHIIYISLTRNSVNICEQDHKKSVVWDQFMR